MRILTPLSLIFLVGSSFEVFSQTSYTDTNATTAWNAARWNNSANGPTYSSTFTSGNNALFTSGNYSFAGMGSSTPIVGNITLNDNVTVTFASIGSTLNTGGNVRTITVGSGSVLDLNAQAISATVGTGFIKNGAGVYATGNGTYQGGFTLNAGTVIAKGTTGMGSGSTNVLTLNGGTVAGNATRSFDNTRFLGGIVIGGNVQFGELSTVVALASSTANLSFANNVSLGSANRTFTLGNQGIQTFSGIISSSGSGGLTFAANAGTSGGLFALTGTANTFTGNISINGGEARFTADGSLGDAANDIVIDGGTFSMAVGATNTISAGRDIFVGDGVGTAIGAEGASGTLIYNGAIVNKSGETGGFTKNGLGVLSLGGNSSYSGNTVVKQGSLLVVSGGSISSSAMTTVNTGATLTANGTVGNVTVDSGGTLKGSGTVNGSATLSGTLAAGNSPGVLTVTGDLTLASGGGMVWELFKNVDSQESPTAAFDQVLVGGNLNFAGGNGITLDFGTTAVGSLVSWSNSFWDSNRSWLLYDVAGTTTGLENLSLLNSVFNDAAGGSLVASRTNASFSLSQSGNDVFLNYNAIPEPSSSLLMVLGVVGLIGIRAFGRKHS
jgi:autotransporter-associated beta strand protein